MDVKIPSTVNVDLASERKKGTFNTLELTHFLDGGEEKTNERRDLENFFLSDGQFLDKIPADYLSHKEKYEIAVEKSCMLFRKIKEYQERKGTGSSVSLFSSVLGGMLGSALIKNSTPFSLHYVMFLPTILGQASEDQQYHWLTRAWNFEILGTYAQTELGHGTFIRGLETEAHYDPTNEEFVLNSPTLTSFKWWPGGLGQTCNYAIVVAQLHTQGKCHGIHPFIVQLRDEETHMPLTGIKIGEIGSKLGMNTVNNGYLGFKNVRIPRGNMLMKNAQVLKDGTYVKAKNEKLTYGTMIFVRVSLIKNVAAAFLAKAVTIATRYSAVRRQSEMKPGEREPQILDYKTQQYKLFPAIATSVALRFSADWLWDIYNSVNADLDRGNMEGLPELHAMSCCLKAVSTSDAANFIEICRRSCGGHGYMNSSNFPNTYGMVTAAETYEGENTVLYLQTARFLIKAWNQLKSGGSVTSTVSYLNQHKVTRSKYSHSLDNLLTAYQQVAAGLIRVSAEMIESNTRSGMSSEVAWNQASILLVQAAEAHCRSFIVDTFIKVLHTAPLSPVLHSVLSQLCELYAIFFLLNSSGNFLLHSNVNSAADIAQIQSRLVQLLEEFRPNAVSTVDAFDIRDEILDSPLGAWDGNVYERLFIEANKSPLNQEPVNKSFHTHIKPFLRSNL
uniref:Acyl-coenzyme A oxidase n=2 Tax=Cacopsylla melanoneura TaxID=428564 RepID=A0A8D8RJH7_9HEMI